MTVDVTPKPEIEPSYLGDGVYAKFDGYHIWLWLQSGERIALEPDVFFALKQYAKRCEMGDL